MQWLFPLTSVHSLPTNQALAAEIVKKSIYSFPLHSEKQVMKKSITFFMN
jgi:hypothetical protein